MIKVIYSISKQLISSCKVYFIVTLFVMLTATSSGDTVLSNGNYAWLIAVLCPFSFVFHDFRGLINLGASKRDYFISCVASYMFLSLSASIVNTSVYLLVDPLYKANKVLNLMDICHWTDNGVVIAAIQQMFFLFLVMLFIHMILSIQEKWYGWAADAVILGIVIIFTPFAFLRNILAEFFSLIMINSNALLHIFVCLLLSMALSFLVVIILRKKTM